MEKPNYQRELDILKSDICERGIRPSLLLHSCCGPCSSYVVTYLKEYFDLTVLYYNPNIYPEAEYDLRLSEQIRLIEEMNRDGAGEIKIVYFPYDHAEFLEAAKGLEREPEGGARCAECFRFRLEKTRALAAEGGFEYFGTTLTVSPHKNAVVINKIGRTIAGEGRKKPSDWHKIQIESPDSGTDSLHENGSPEWLPSDFKKKDGYKKSIELSHQYDLYRQDYCGCEFSNWHLNADDLSV